MMAGSIYNNRESGTLRESNHECPPAESDQ